MTRAEDIMRSAEARLTRALRAFEDDEPVDEFFGAPTDSERKQLEAERREIERIELEARHTPTTPPKRSRSSLLWIRNKVPR